MTGCQSRVQERGRGRGRRLHRKKQIDDDEEDRDTYSGMRGRERYRETADAGFECDFPGCDLGPFRSSAALEGHRALRHADPVEEEDE